MIYSQYAVGGIGDSFTVSCILDTFYVVTDRFWTFDTTRLEESTGRSVPYHYLSLPVTTYTAITTYHCLVSKAINSAHVAKFIGMIVAISLNLSFVHCF